LTCFALALVALVSIVNGTDTGSEPGVSDGLAALVLESVAGDVGVGKEVAGGSRSTLRRKGFVDIGFG
jgi:hypothetical protein